VLSSCQAVVNKLRQKGQITAEEERKSRVYLQLHDKPWPRQSEISDGAVLYLDDLSVTYFLHLGLLQKLKPAGFSAIVSPRKISEINELISYESISSKVQDAIESIRTVLNSRIESGKIRVGGRSKSDKPPKTSISQSTIFDVIAMACHCEAIIVDDRFINRHANISDGSSATPTFSTLDLLDHLVSADSITPEERMEYRTLLRRAGYSFIPVSEDELSCHLEASPVMDGKVIETAELKAIRETVLRIRMTSWLQLPMEAPWLDSFLKSFVLVLKGVWRTDADLSSVRARANWIMDQVDLRGWAQTFGGEKGDALVKIGRGAYILMLLSPPTDAPAVVKDAYWSWIEERVLAPIKEQYPDLYSWIVDWQRRQIADAANTDLSKEVRNEE
jgi:hypothetical protein